jgi:TRAP-type mannitol/chloroaromatic compound transport system substrate-binding protein
LAVDTVAATQLGFSSWQHLQPYYQAYGFQSATHFELNVNQNTFTKKSSSIKQVFNSSKKPAAERR